MGNGYLRGGMRCCRETIPSDGLQAGVRTFSNGMELFDELWKMERKICWAVGSDQMLNRAWVIQCLQSCVM